MNSTIVKLIRYFNIFGEIEWLDRDQAKEKLQREQKLYERWKSLGEHISPPRIEG